MSSSTFDRACYPARGVLKGHALRQALRVRLRERERSSDARNKTAERGRAAVLIALFDRDEETQMWLLRRPENMRDHGGQVAFPGGKSDAADASLLETALREAHEELAIPPDAVDVLGPLDDYVTITGFTVTPYVGWIAADLTIVPNVHEVARVFAAPLALFLPSAFGAVDRVRDLIPPLAVNVDGERVWGATASMARSLACLVSGLS